MPVTRSHGVAGLIRYSSQAEAFTSFMKAVYDHRVWPGCLCVDLEHPREPKNMRLGSDDHVF